MGADPMRESPKPCPQCGGKPSLVHGHRNGSAYSYGCYKCSRFGHYLTDDKERVKSWNETVEAMIKELAENPPPPTLAEQLATVTAQRDALLAACKKYDEAWSKVFPEGPWDAQTIWSQIRAAIALCEGDPK